MARKRLTPALPGYLETKSALAPPARAPIAQVAGEAAAASAFHDVATELAAARAEGRLVLALPLTAVSANHLIRDRLVSDAQDMEALKASLSARGQQTPIEVVDLGDGRYGLISGMRRLTALTALHRDTGEARFATVQALVRSPDSDASAYIAMVEENEIRVGLSFYERAALVRRAVNTRIFVDDQSALQTLFAQVSYSKRSKIKSFLTIVDYLGPDLRHPTQISEHLGLKLAKRLGEDPQLATRLSKDLAADPCRDPDSEQAILKRHLSHAKGPAKPAPAAKAEPDKAPRGDGIELAHSGETVTLQGPQVTPEFVAKLKAWLHSST